MLRIDKAIKLNKYGQGLIISETFLKEFSEFELIEKINYLREIIALIQQSKPKEDDIQPAIFESKLKPTFTPCILLAKGVANHNLQKIAALPEFELDKALILLLSLFKISYDRRFRKEINNPNKWWYWDLSDEQKVRLILESYK